MTKFDAIVIGAGMAGSAAAWQLSKDGRRVLLLEQFNITHIRKSKASKLSGGERRRLEMARCLVSDPQIVMLDEPFAGVDPVTVQSIQQIVERLRQSGISILITDHAAREILAFVDRCYVISKGQVLCEGTPDQVRSHPEVRRQYLGNMDGDSSGSNERRSSEREEVPKQPPRAPSMIRRSAVARKRQDVE